MLCRTIAAVAGLLSAGDLWASSPQVALETTLGAIVIELDPVAAPETVENFLAYVDADFYAGTIFHRVIPGFMIQGGGFTRGYERKPVGEPIRNEADNGLSNERYTVAMARTNAPHSATSQFFINTADNPHLDFRAPTDRDWGYAVFGRVVDGHAVVDRIESASTGAGGPFSRDAPREPIEIIETRRLDEEVATADEP